MSATLRSCQADCCGWRDNHPHPTRTLKGSASPASLEGTALCQLMTHGRVPMDPILIKRIVEAALLAANQPLTAVQLPALFPLDEPAPAGSIAQALESLQADCRSDERRVGKECVSTCSYRWYPTH